MEASTVEVFGPSYVLCSAAQSIMKKMQQETFPTLTYRIHVNTQHILFPLKIEVGLVLEHYGNTKCFFTYHLHTLKDMTKVIGQIGCITGRCMDDYLELLLDVHTCFGTSE